MEWIVNCSQCVSVAFNIYGIVVNGRSLVDLKQVYPLVVEEIPVERLCKEHAKASRDSKYHIFECCKVKIRFTIVFGLVVRVVPRQ